MLEGAKFVSLVDLILFSVILFKGVLVWLSLGGQGIWFYFRLNWLGVWWIK